MVKSAVHGLLHLAMAAVAPFHGVGGRPAAVVQERQGLLEVGESSLSRLGLNPLSWLTSPPQPVQFRQRRLGAAAAVEQPIDLLHDLPQRPQLRLPRVIHCSILVLGRRQMAPHEQVAMLEQIPHLPLQVPAPPGLTLGLRCRAATTHLRHLAVSCLRT